MDEAAFAVLDAELRARHRDIQRIGDRIEERRGSFVSGAEAVDSLGYQLHNLYGAVEQLFEEVARSFENRIEAAGYHVNLIRRMQLDIPGIRPALLSERTASDLDELRRFRHRFRHAYAAELDSEKIAALAGKTRQIREDFARDLERFLARLRPQ
ncbi:MAG: hypothetical protein F4Y45_00575 [Acidobacteria bacterium]|nr:hypothetical protein [Acidobacteriota bacterium]MYJ05731.1 hypothetical protein [Acidobacteriota bacterium]